MMISAQVNKTTATITDNSPSQNYSYPDNQTATSNVVPEHSISYLYFHPQSIWNENTRYPYKPFTDSRCSHRAYSQSLRIAFVSSISLPIIECYTAFSSALLHVSYSLLCDFIMVGCSTTKTAVKSFAVFVAFSVLQRCSSSSPGSVWEGNSHIAQQFGFPFPFPLPKFNFSDVSEECQAMVQKLLKSPLSLKCEYSASNFQLFVQESLIYLDGGVTTK